MPQERLYVITRSDLSVGQQSVQAGHAVQAWDIDYPPTKVATKVYLVVDDEPALNTLVKRLTSIWSDHASFHEPNLNYALTAIASNHDGNLFDGLKKLGE